MKYTSYLYHHHNMTPRELSLHITAGAALILIIGGGAFSINSIIINTSTSASVNYSTAQLHTALEAVSYTTSNKAYPVSFPISTPVSYQKELLEF